MRKRAIFKVTAMVSIVFLAMSMLHTLSLSLGVFSAASEEETRALANDILVLRPDGDGDYTQWIQYPVTSSRWECLVHHNDDDDYVYIAVDSQQNFCDLEDHTSEKGGISNVKAVIYARRADVLAGKLTIEIIVGGSLHEGATVDLSQTYAKYESDWAQNPKTDTSWTWADIDTLQAGFKSVQDGDSPTLWRVTQLYVEITYTRDDDVFVHIDDLHVHRIPDVIETNAEVYVKVKLHYPQNKECTWITQKTKVIKLAVCEGGDEFGCHTFPFHHFVPNLIEFWVMDEDLWYDDEMAHGGPMAVPLDTQFGATGEYASITLSVHAQFSNCGVDHNTAERIGISPDLGYGENFDVQLNLDVNDAEPPTTVTITEQIPTGFTFVAATPTQTSISYITDPEDGLEITEVNWVFSEGDVYDRTIVYTVTCPSTYAIEYFGGETESDGKTMVTFGQSKVTVGVSVVGGLLLPIDKLGLLAPYIGLASTIVVATVATAVYAKRVKRRKEN